MKKKKSSARRSSTPRVGIVAAQFNPLYTDALLASARGELADCEVVVVRVPGSFEIPLGLLRMAKQESFDALIALGLIWEGETMHADLIARECARSCMEISLSFDLPVIFEVLTVKTEAQAKARCMGQKLNRGIEAARAALAMINPEAS